MKERVLEETEKLINNILDEGIQSNNLDSLYKLIDIHKDVKEEENMRYMGYDSYGEGSYGRGTYGRDSYGRRGYDAKYRGYDNIDRIGNEYGRYMESRERYGHGEETDKSYHYMLEALKDFSKVLREEAETPQQQQMLRDTLQSMMM